MRNYLFLSAAALALGGCAVPLLNGPGEPAYRQGRALIESGNPEQGLARVQEAVRLEPSNQEYKAYYYRRRDLAVQHYIAVADHARATGHFELAEQGYRRAQALDSTNPRAAEAIATLAADRRHRATLDAAEELL